MRRARQVGNARFWLWGSLLSALASCGSTREVTTLAPTSSSTSITPNVAATVAPADYATVVTGRTGVSSRSPTASSPTALVVRPATVVPMPVFKAPARRPEVEPSGIRTAVPTRSSAPVVVPARVLSPKSVTKVTRTQSGRVIDEAGQPLVGATVLLKGTAKGASTDANGNYSLEVPPGTNTFIFGYGGYQDEIVQSHDGQPLNMTLLPLATKAKP
jgi:hypothetical protein